MFLNGLYFMCVPKLHRLICSVRTSRNLQFLGNRGNSFVICYVLFIVLNSSFFRLTSTVTKTCLNPLYFQYILYLHIYYTIICDILFLISDTAQYSDTRTTAMPRTRSDRSQSSDSRAERAVSRDMFKEVDNLASKFDTLSTHTAALSRRSQMGMHLNCFSGDPSENVAIFIKGFKSEMSILEYREDCPAMQDISIFTS
uniref:V-SNARE coiled-coil homology domain-containing protein n=1 Tax=Heterorhabditis bacteriophora TaxID=37862 RepID=A0A1I7WIC3_HETBA